MVKTVQSLEEALQQAAQCRSALLNDDLVVVKNAVPVDYIEKQIRYLSDVGRNSFPQYQSVRFGAPNFHRVVRNDPRSYVRGVFHQFSLFPWNQDPFDSFSIMHPVFALKNKLSELDENYLLEPTPTSIAFPRLSFQHYPKGEGYLSLHEDPVGTHQDFVATLCMSQMGRDYESGGIYFKAKGETVFPETIASVGDVFIFRANLPHGVETIDAGKDSHWLDFNGRWMMIFAINANAELNTGIQSRQL